MKTVEEIKFWPDETDWIIWQTVIETCNVSIYISLYLINKEQLVFPWCKADTVFYTAGWICMIFSWTSFSLPAVWPLQGVKVARLMNFGPWALPFMITESYFTGNTSIFYIPEKSYVTGVSDSGFKQWLTTSLFSRHTRNFFIVLGYELCVCYPMAISAKSQHWDPAPVLTKPT